MSKRLTGIRENPHYDEGAKVKFYFSYTCTHKPQSFIWQGGEIRINVVKSLAGTK